MKKITVLLFNDFTNDNRVLKECRSLVKNGFEVELVTTHFDKKLPKEERGEDFLVKRYNVGRFHFLPINLILFWLYIIFKCRKDNIFHCNDLYALPPAYFIKKFLNKEAQIVYDCHEHETEAQIYYKKPILKKIAQIFERKMIYSADKVIVVSESIGEDYVKMYDIEKPYLVMNCPVFKRYEDSGYFREKFEIPKEHIIFVYVGVYKQGRGLERLVEVFREASKMNKKISLVILSWGDGIEELKESIKDDKNIFWHDKAPVDTYMEYVSSADWGVLFFENLTKNNNYALPNKLFDYVMGGLPVLASNLKEITKFINRNKVGYVVDYEDDKQIIDTLIGINSKKEKFLSAIEETRKKYSWEGQEKVLINLYKSLK